MNGAMRDPGCRIKKSGGALALLLAAVAAGAVSGPTGQEPAPGEVYRFRVPVNLVLLNVRVSGADGERPPALHQDDFTLLEGGKPQAIRVFENPQKQARLVLVLDVSGSTSTKIEEIRRATQQFLDELAEHDEVALLAVGPTYQLLQEFTGWKAEAHRLLRRLREPSSQQYIDPVAIAVIYIGLGQNEQALTWLARGYEYRGSTRILILKVDPVFDPLRDDPRFRFLLRRMNFPP